MLRFQGAVAVFDSPLTVQVQFSNAETGEAATLSKTVHPPEAPAGTFSFRREIWAAIRSRGWKPSKVRIDRVGLSHPVARGDRDEREFCSIIENELKLAYPV